MEEKKKVAQKKKEARLKRREEMEEKKKVTQKKKDARLKRRESEKNKFEKNKLEKKLKNHQHPSFRVAKTTFDYPLNFLNFRDSFYAMPGAPSSDEEPPCADEQAAGVSGTQPPPRPPRGVRFAPTPVSSRTPSPTLAPATRIVGTLPHTRGGGRTRPYDEEAHDYADQVTAGE